MLVELNRQELANQGWEFAHSLISLKSNEQFEQIAQVANQK